MQKAERPAELRELDLERNGEEIVLAPYQHLWMRG
jgi:hypothetical protein